MTNRTIQLIPKGRHRHQANHRIVVINHSQIRRRNVEFALVDGQRMQPFPKGSGKCLFCDGLMSAKCGKQKRWHWAHKPDANCDPWWENETDWHRSWKSRFPETWREVIHFSESNEKHIADVKTPTGQVFEFQNSTMTINELKSREEFYGNVIWIVNGVKFRSNFSILDRLPNPDAEFTKDIVFCQQSLERPCFCYWRRSQNPDYRRVGDFVQMLSPTELGEEGMQELINDAYIGHHWFDWKHHREVWFNSDQRVLFDFSRDDGLLVELLLYRDYGEYSPFCVKLVSAVHLIEQHGGQWAAK